jgi:hypothetical protein
MSGSLAGCIGDTENTILTIEVEQPLKINK